MSQIHFAYVLNKHKRKYDVKLLLNYYSFYYKDNSKDKILIHIVYYDFCD